MKTQSTVLSVFSSFQLIENVDCRVRVQARLSSAQTEPSQWHQLSRSPFVRRTHRFMDCPRSIAAICQVGCILPFFDRCIGFPPSDKAIFENGKAIRGGVPVVWPQFGPGQLPQHGFARVKAWQLGDKSIGDDVTVQLHLSEDESTLKIWPHKFHLTVTVRLSGQTLHQELAVKNTDDHPFDFTALFHTYFTVDDIKKTKV